VLHRLLHFKGTTIDNTLLALHICYHHYRRVFTHPSILCHVNIGGVSRETCVNKFASG